MSQDPNALARFRTYKATMLEKIHVIPDDKSWDAKKGQWRSSISCVSYCDLTPGKTLSISRPKASYIRYPKNDKSAEGIPVCESKRHRWLMLRIAGTSFGFANADIFDGWDSTTSEFYAHVVFARYPTLLRQYPSWNKFESHSRVLHHMLDSDVPAENFEELQKPLSDEEMESLEAEFRLRGFN